MLTREPLSAEAVRRFGAHTSVAGGLANGAREAIALGANAFQIFTRSPRMWAAPPLDAADVAELGRLRREGDLRPLVIHGSYLLNLAAGDPANRARSILGFRDEVERAAAIDADYLVFHPGSAKDFETPEEAIDSLSDALAEALEGVECGSLTILFENTAGGGASLGRRFEELAAIREAAAAKVRAPLGFCLDTCHLFAAGYDIGESCILEETLAAADALLGLGAVRVIHCNDSKGKLGSRIDRHARLGEGLLGWDAMERIVQRPELADKVFILETPHDDDGTHTQGVAALRRMMDGARERE
ncbi:MAG: deoxyribonuclease IV [Acidobacteria bacterium]|nr:deoxyribonuclease IV [Acidobacteriota bacterium]